jgi:hypothetical protein
MQNITWKSVALVLAGIILGCGATVLRGAQAQSGAPRPTFAPNPAATKWQQYCTYFRSYEEANQYAEWAGAQGFELVEGTKIQADLALCFKRPAA